jgi:hypothetical protein
MTKTELQNELAQRAAAATAIVKASMASNAAYHKALVVIGCKIGRATCDIGPGEPGGADVRDGAYVGPRVVFNTEGTQSYREGDTLRLVEIDGAGLHCLELADEPDSRASLIDLLAPNMN